MHVVKQHKARNLVLFDGECHFCNGFVRFILRFEASPHYSFASLQSETGQPYQVYQSEKGGLSTIVVVEQGKVWTKSRAVFKILSHLRWPFSWMGGLRILPVALTDGVYDFVARRRKLLMKSSSQCELPDTATRKRFYY